MVQSAPPVLFLHIGWARDYRGASDDPVQGKFGYIRDGNEDMGEALNFRPYKKRCYGYAPVRRLDLDRIGGIIQIDEIEGETAYYLDDVTVVWTATNPADGNRYIVGWYNSARVYEHGQPLRPIKSRSDVQVVADHGNTHLIPEDDRTFFVPAREKGWPGTSSAFYASDNLSSDSLAKVLNYTNGQPSNGFVPEQPQAIHKAGLFGTDAEARAKVEKAAEDCVVAHYKADHWTVEDVSKQNLGWDLTATKGARRLLIEVKGRAGVGSVVLTQNERNTMDNEKTRMLYRLAIVFNACASPKMTIFRYIAGRKAWISEEGHVLSFEPMPGVVARF